MVSEPIRTVNLIMSLRGEIISPLRENEDRFKKQEAITNHILRAKFRNLQL